MSLINGIDDIMTHIKNQELRIQKLEQENKKLKQQNDAIMEDEDSQHILGCNAYEKFMQAMCELNYDEKLIKELKDKIVDIEGEKLELQINKDKSVEYLQQAWTKKELFELICNEGLWDEDDDEDDFDVEEWISSLQQQREELEELKGEKDDLRDFAWTMYDLMECCPYTGNDKKDFDYYVKGGQGDSSEEEEDEESDEEENKQQQEEEEYVEDINGYKVNMEKIKYMSDKFGFSVEEVKEMIKVSDCDFTEE